MPECLTVRVTYLLPKNKGKNKCRNLRTHHRIPSDNIENDVIDTKRESSQIH